ncbi:MAG: prepilin-type N-terminal cleavage/methylation domain-containing protein [Candidatus Aureabacteria bacterium]|jgi:prepilin-type N-terminal cleavage/methylation domain-containing protein|nr:prepilin-type N-terminal cleavage/methylation domain-containing protein [Candidatus Auribacterota bacterium]NLW93608.1 prepilin-type N-terminal cleavage/methylation domain-containing protein [Chlamydiota bacterium]HOE27335.1 prepilin-type N-terminal cleavage/methylation domain-containing protein [bacterium]
MGAGRRRGMTLMEVLIAIVLVAVAFGGLATAVTWSIQTIRASRESAAALQAAQQEIERMRNASFASVAPHTFAVPSLRNRDGTAVSGSFAVQDETATMKKVTAHVGWVSHAGPPPGRPMHVSLATYITKEGIGRP